MNFNRTTVLLILSLLILVVFLPVIVYAQANFNYELLQPEVVDGAGSNLTEYARAAFTTVLVVAGVLAIIMFTWGALEYLVSAIPGVQTQAKARMIGAIAGLILALLSWLILNTINPDLVNFDLNLDTVGNNLPTGIESDHTGGRRSDLPGAPRVSTPADANCENCVSLRDRGAQVANWYGINGPGRTDMVNTEVADAIIRVQQQAASEGLRTQITAAHTNGVGHSAGSNHYLGRAVDIQPANRNEVTRANLERLAAMCRQAGLYALVESRHVHCDSR